MPVLLPAGGIGEAGEQYDEVVHSGARMEPVSASASFPHLCSLHKQHADETLCSKHQASPLLDHGHAAPHDGQLECTHAACQLMGLSAPDTCLVDGSGPGRPVQTSRAKSKSELAFRPAHASAACTYHCDARIELIRPHPRVQVMGRTCAHRSSDLDLTVALCAHHT